MVEIDIRYEGELRCDALHQPSSTHLRTDAPVDNHGKGESFSPTDLVAAALGTCMATVMGIAAGKHGWNIDGITLKVEKEMTTEPPRRIERLTVAFTVPEDVSAELPLEAMAALEHAAHTCPVRLSILDAIEVPVRFGW